MNHSLSNKQRGIVIPLVAISALVIIATAGLAVDISHAFTTKSKLQNALDAAALAAAAVGDKSGSQNQAESAARDVYTKNVSGTGNAELVNLGATADKLNFEWALTYNPWTPSGVSTNFVKVTLDESLNLTTWFARVVGQNTLQVNTSAVAGLTPRLEVICNLAPVMLCGDAAAGSDDNQVFGYTDGQNVTLKISSNMVSTVGPGNFQYINLVGNQGANDLKFALAGDYQKCTAVTNNLDTKPGTSVGPTEGINTRFGQYCGSLKNAASSYPPDYVTNAGSGTYPVSGDGCNPKASLAGLPDTYAQYKADYTSTSYDNPSLGIPFRRMLVVPVGDCSTTIAGASSTVPVLGMACAFLTQPAVHDGPDDFIYGEIVIKDCNTGGVAGNAEGNGLHTVQLYGTPGLWDS